MILDGDILNYFESIHKNVTYIDENNISTFEFVLDYLSLKAKPKLILDKKKNLISLVVYIKNVKFKEEIYPLLNSFNLKSNLLKASYDKANYQIIISANQYLNEENAFLIIDNLIKSFEGDEYDFLEDIYHLENTMDESVKDKSLDALMGLLDSHKI